MYNRNENKNFINYIPFFRKILLSMFLKSVILMLCLPCLIYELKTLLHWAIILHKLWCLLAVVASDEEHSWGGGPGHMPKSLLPESVWCPVPGPSCPLVTSCQGVNFIRIISTSTRKPSHLHSIKNSLRALRYRLENLNWFLIDYGSKMFARYWNCPCPIYCLLISVLISWRMPEFLALCLAVPVSRLR